jgi:hypothetical protein
MFGLDNLYEIKILLIYTKAYLEGRSSNDVGAFGLVLKKGFDLVHRPVEGHDLEAVVVHVQNDVLEEEIDALNSSKFELSLVPVKFN